MKTAEAIEQLAAQRKSKYNRENLPKFSNQEVQQARVSGVIKDDESNVWRYVKSGYGKDELYCEILHLSIPLYDNQPKPLDPLRKFK